MKRFAISGEHDSFWVYHLEKDIINVVVFPGNLPKIQYWSNLIFEHELATQEGACLLVKLMKGDMVIILLFPLYRQSKQYPKLFVQFVYIIVVIC